MLCDMAKMARYHAAGLAARGRVRRMRNRKPCRPGAVSRCMLLVLGRDTEFPRSSGQARSRGYPFARARHVVSVPMHIGGTVMSLRFKSTLRL